MTIPALPPLDRTSPTFKADLDTFFLTQLPDTVTALNAESARIDGIVPAGFVGTSTTNLPIAGSGPVAITVEAGKAFITGHRVLIAADSGNRMLGTVASYNATTGAMVANIISSTGSGTYAGWAVGIAPDAAPDASYPQLTAKGAIASAGLAVLLNNDGTVSTFVPGSVGASAVASSESADQICSTYDSANGKIIVAYVTGSGAANAKIVVGTVAGTTITFGTLVSISAGTVDQLALTYDSTNQKVVLFYRDQGNSSYGTARVGTVSGTSITLGTPVVFQSVNTYNISAAYHVVNQKVVVVCSDGSNSDGKAYVGTVSGTSISFGAMLVYSSTATSSQIVYDSNNQKMVAAWIRGSTIEGAVLSMSGTTLTAGTVAVFTPASVPTEPRMAYSPIAQKVVIAYQCAGLGQAVVATVSGTTISYGIAATFQAAGVSSLSVSWDAAVGCTIITYTNASNSNYGTFLRADVSGSSISFGAGAVYISEAASMHSNVYDSVNGKTVVAYRRGAGSSISAVTVAPSNFASNFVGISQASAADGSLVPLAVPGALDVNQSGLTPGGAYYLGLASGALSQTVSAQKVGVATAANKLLVTNWSF